MATTLTQADVARLLAEPSAPVRAEIVSKIAVDIDNPQLTATERTLAQSILEATSRDVAVEVREALAQNLLHAKNIPHDLALRLANDLDSISLPIIEHSPLLTEKDLLAVVAAGSAAKQEAVAARPDVTVTVADALIDRGNEKVVGILMNNNAAQISEAGLNKVVDKFAKSDFIKESVVKRTVLPVAVAERLVFMVAEQLKDYLIKNHELSPATAADLVLQSRERSTVALSLGADAPDVAQLVAEMHANKRLTPSLVLRALCLGDIAFFEAAMATLANIPIVNASILIHQGGLHGLASLYDKTKLPGSLFTGVRIAINVIHETPLDGGPRDRERYRTKVLQRILTDPQGLTDDDINYLVARLENART